MLKNQRFIKNIFNKYGMYFACEKAIKGTKVRGCFKVKGKHPTIYITDNYAGKDSFFFELFHELGHCKSDYNEAQSKVIIDGNEEKEEKADIVIPLIKEKSNDEFNININNYFIYKNKK